ncbi:MAG: type IV secretion system DNA-binding domain-containing protein [Rhodospirillaceae bacterium]
MTETTGVARKSLAFPLFSGAVVGLGTCWGTLVAQAKWFAGVTASVGGIKGYANSDWVYQYSVDCLLRNMPFVNMKWLSAKDLFLTSFDAGSNLEEQILTITNKATAIGIIAAIPVIFYLYSQQEKRLQGMRNLRGRQLREGQPAIQCANKVFKDDIPRDGAGLYLTPGVLMDRGHETTGILIMGAPGSGKTVWMQFLMDQVIKRSTKNYRLLKPMVDEISSSLTKEQRIAAIEALIKKTRAYPDKIIGLDVKGDVTEKWAQENDEIILFAPHDSGRRPVLDAKGNPVLDENDQPVEQFIGYAWDIAGDIDSLPACQDFAAMVIPPSDEPQWAQASRRIVTGIIYGLLKDCALENKRRADAANGKPFTKKWFGWAEIHYWATRPPKQLREFLVTWYPDAAEFIIVKDDGGLSDTSASYFSGYQAAFLPTCEALAAAWRDYPQERYLSLKKWLADPMAKQRTLLLQKSLQFEEVSSAWIKAVIGRTSKFVGSGLLKDDKNRRIWLFLDELPQVTSKDDGLLKFMEVGRSKGFCTVTGVQVIDQLEERWGSESLVRTLEAMVRIKLVFRVEAGSFSKYVSEELIGSSDVSSRDVSRSSGNGSSTSTSRKIEYRLVVLPSELSSRLGKDNKGVKCMLVAENDVCILHTPFSNWYERREGTVPANWTFDPLTDFNARLPDHDGIVEPTIAEQQVKVAHSETVEPKRDLPVTHVPLMEDGADLSDRLTDRKSAMY